jgi:hypothetical protein
MSTPLDTAKKLPLSPLEGPQKSFTQRFVELFRAFAVSELQGDYMR